MYGFPAILLSADDRTKAAPAIAVASKALLGGNVTLLSCLEGQITPPGFPSGCRPSLQVCSQSPSHLLTFPPAHRHQANLRHAKSGFQTDHTYMLRHIFLAEHQIKWSHLATHELHSCCLFTSACFQKAWMLHIGHRGPPAYQPSAVTRCNLLWLPLKQVLSLEACW